MKTVLFPLVLLIGFSTSNVGLANRSRGAIEARIREGHGGHGIFDGRVLQLCGGGPRQSNERYHLQQEPEPRVCSARFHVS